MLITFLDNSHIIYDGSTINNKPLDGAEKSLIYLSEAFANIGHVVRVYNNCYESIVINDVSWQKINKIDATHSDVWIAHNDPKLFDLVDSNSKKILWLTSSGLKLARPENFTAAMKHKPTIIIQGENHINSIPDGLKSLDASIIPSGNNPYFIENQSLLPSITPKALVTTHPLMGLDWIINLWVQHIHTKLPWAELHIYSYTLHKAMSGKKIPDIYNSILKLVETNLAYNIKIKSPKIDTEMVKEIKDMRVHLYPSHKYEVSAFSLSETQVLGMPAVIRPLGAAIEKIYNGKTGFIANDESQFVEYSTRILSDLSFFNRMYEESKVINKLRSWDKVAEEFLQVFKSR